MGMRWEVRMSSRNGRLVFRADKQKKKVLCHKKPAHLLGEIRGELKSDTLRQGKSHERYYKNDKVAPLYLIRYLSYLAHDSRLPIQNTIQAPTLRVQKNPGLLIRPFPPISLYTLFPHPYLRTYYRMVDQGSECIFVTLLVVGSL